jgi:subtilisin family serine protease
VRPIFAESTVPEAGSPRAEAHALAAAIVECVDDGVRVVNLSLGVVPGTARAEHELYLALEYARELGVLVAAAAGNQGTIGGTVITRHPWVVPVVACDRRGQPTRTSNLGRTIGRHGLLAPGSSITSLRAQSGVADHSGTSAATPFVTGTFALLRSLFPQTAAAQIRRAVVERSRWYRRSVTPPMLDAWSAYQFLRGPVHPN